VCVCACVCVCVRVCVCVCIQGHLNAVALLIELGCDPLHRDVLGRCCLHWAAKAGYSEVYMCSL
jgi:ankyrin repeat protein